MEMYAVVLPATKVCLLQTHRIQTRIKLAQYYNAIIVEIAKYVKEILDYGTKNIAHCNRYSADFQAY